MRSTSHRSRRPGRRWSSNADPMASLAACRPRPSGPCPRPCGGPELELVVVHVAVPCGPRTDRAPGGPAQVVLVDNASVDGSLERLRQEFPDVRIVRNDANLGFAEGCNRAMRDLRRVDMVALVNNDAVVEPGWLSAWSSALDEHPRAGAAAARGWCSSPRSPGSGSRCRVTRSRVCSVRVDGVDVYDQDPLLGAPSAPRAVPSGRWSWSTTWTGSQSSSCPWGTASTWSSSPSRGAAG